jgi:hypothetical protein
MADPSMDKQELYVATSRSREETYLYATPEIQTPREEIAPESPYSREGIPHIAEAAERDRAQLAAHDAAQLEALPTSELVARHRELEIAAAREVEFAERQDRLQGRIEQARERLQRLEAQREAAEALPRRQQRRELPRIEVQEPISRERIVHLEAEMRELSSGDAARRELIEVDRVLAKRRELAITAARIAPPTYITAELGERPSNPTKRMAWDRSVASIERYRQEHGVVDRNRALGAEPQQRVERARREAELRRLGQAQRQLGRDPGKVRARERRRGLGIVR